MNALKNRFSLVISVGDVLKPLLLDWLNNSANLVIFKFWNFMFDLKDNFVNN